MFTQTFYQFLFNGNNVCDSFDKAKKDVESNFGKKEAKIFSIFRQNDSETFYDFDFL